MARRAPVARSAAHPSAFPALVVAAKAPVPGAVKTRLVRDGVSERRAAALAGAFLLDTLDKARHPCVGARVTLALDGDPAALPEGTPTPEDVPRTAQIGNDLGARIVQMTEDRFREDAGFVVVIGSDSPHLPAAFLAEAFGRLGRGDAAADVVLGPSEDGGYYLVGLRGDAGDRDGAPAPGLFRDIPWSTDAVFDVTRERARALGLRVALLPRWYDIDTGADLERLRRDLGRGVVGAPHTAEALRAIARAGASPAG